MKRKHERKLTDMHLRTLTIALENAAKELSVYRQNRALTKTEIFSELLLNAAREKKS